MWKPPAEDPTPDLETDAPELPSAPYLNILAIAPARKTVPYGGSGIRRPDGGTNFGFTNLKRRPELLDSIPEFASDPALRSLMAAIDRPETGVFSIACLSKTIADEQGFRVSGYVEFALNGKDEVVDAGQYFRLFHLFDQRLRDRGFTEPVSFQWELCPTTFADAGLDGYAADVRIDTDYRVGPEAAYECWTRALCMLEAVLAGVPARSREPIYVAETGAKA